MSPSDHILALTLGSTAAALVLAFSSAQAGDPERGQHLEVQIGPLALNLGGQERISLGARTDCLRQGCPILNVAIARSAAPQTAPGESRRVKTCETGAFQRAWFIAERADEGFGEQGRVCKATGAETA